jgi:hypothetical protein
VNFVVWAFAGVEELERNAPTSILRVTGRKPCQMLATLPPNSSIVMSMALVSYPLMCLSRITVC